MAWSSSGPASAAFTSRTDSPRTNEAITSDSRALLLLIFAPDRLEANVAVVPGSSGRWWRYLACLAVEEPQAGWPHGCHLPRLGTSVMAAAAIWHGCLLRPAGARLP